MKKTFKNIRTLAALLIASAAFTACSNEDSAIIGEQPAQQQAPQVFTLTLQAGKTDGAGTRALALDGTKLVAKWAAGDQVTVVKDGTSLGTLTASNVCTDGKTCTFSGALSTAPSANDALTLTYHPVASLSAYTSQTGTLTSAADYDVATATVTVASVSGGEITIKETSATFSTQTAVLKLTLKDVADNALKATSLKISVEDVDIFTFTPTDATYTANGNGILYFALPSQAAVETGMGITAGALASVPITFTATVGSDTYTATKMGYKLAGGKYYATELKMTPAAPEYYNKLTKINDSFNDQVNVLKQLGRGRQAYNSSLTAAQAYALATYQAAIDGKPVYVIMSSQDEGYEIHYTLSTDAAATEHSADLYDICNVSNPVRMYYVAQ